MGEFETVQFSTFKDCIAQRMLHRNDSESDSQDSAALDDFASYLATESWPTLPDNVKNATYETREKVTEVDNIPLDSTSTGFIDSLLSYRMVPDTEDALKFLRKVIEDYIEQACAPPPVWSSTRTSECEICFREIPLTYHHLIPRSTHAKALKKGWHTEAMINSVAWLCRPCHNVVHHVATNEELAQNFYSVELLLQREDVQKWQKYAAKQRFGVRRG